MKKFEIICPDGVNRLGANWDKLSDAIFDSKYMSNRSSCWDWCDLDGDHECPGGTHTVKMPTKEPLEFVWTLDLIF